MKMRKLVFVSIALLFSTVAFAIDLPLFQKSARLLEDAQFAFDSGEYGKALLLAEEAKLLRQREATESLDALNAALHPQEVQNAGDNIHDVIAVLQSRDVYDVVNLIDYTTSLHNGTFFNGSITEIQKHLAAKKIFPEASHLMARIYEFEGEYELSYSYYMDAWNHGDILDIPESKYDILYDMANLSYNFNDYENCEKALMLIIASDPYYGNDGFTAALTNSVQRGYSADKIFSLYRADCYRSIPAFFRLTELYVEQERYQEAFKMSLFGTLSSFTRMNNFLTNRVTEFQYENLREFFHIAIDNYELAEWSMEQGFWRCFYRLADLGSQMFPENEDFAKELLVVIAQTAPESYWRQLAVAKL